ncbi:zinc finger protein 862-like [Acanthaster planci]|uniref:Zinc finger protein 862-like n=1 Tax=Acanthaster planci TaxID=133434 RepID=A0A8B7ZPJ5_ACAPL|nr:zinc finger protein 862-like [Acanthaster planci]
MFCLLCQKYKKMPYGRPKWNTAPCIRMREGSVKEHEECESHKDAMQKDRENMLMQDIREASNPAVSLSAMEKAFASLYFLVQRRVAHITNFEPLLDFLSFLGLKVKEQIRVAKNATYTSDKTVQEMLYVLSEVLEDDTLKELATSDHFALIFDESSDCTNIEQLALHARYLNSDGDLQVKFLKIVDVLQPEIDAISRAARSGDGYPNEAGIISLNAEVITKRVKEYIEKAGIDMQRMRGVGTDGAAVMTGRKSGVVKRLKDDVPCLIGIHCTAHRLNLASSQAAKCIKDVDQFENVLRQLFDFFDNSNVRTAGFLAVQNILLPQKEGEGKTDTPGKLLEPSTTRWLSIGNSVERVKKAFPDLIVTLQREGTERTDTRALGLNRLVTTYKFTATMLLLCDVLPHINALSKAFQKKDSDYTLVHELVTSTITTLKSLKETDGVNLARLPEFLAIAKLGPQNPSDETHFRNNVRGRYIDALTENLQDRFNGEDVQGMSLLLSLFKLSEIHLTPTSQLPDYGKSTVTAAHGFFEASNVLGTLDELQQEWMSLKNYTKQVSEMSDTDLIQRLCTRQALQAVYPNFSQRSLGSFLQTQLIQREHSHN